MICKISDTEHEVIPSELQHSQAYYLKIEQKFQFSKMEFLKQCVVLKIKVCSTFQKLLALKLCN